MNGPGPFVARTAATRSSPAGEIGSMSGTTLIQVECGALSLKKRVVSRNEGIAGTKLPSLK